MGSGKRSRRTRSLAALTLLAGILVAALAIASGERFEPADFVFNNGGEVSTLDPHTATSVSEGRVLRALYEGLATRNPRSLQPEPGAADWEVDRDGLNYVFTLREELRWSNGDPLTADDFEWSFRRVLTPATGAPFAYLLDCVEGAAAFRKGETQDWSTVGIRAVDERTLELRLTTATVLLEILSMSAFSPVHRASLERAQREHPATWQIEWLRPQNLVVNGPFTILERRVNDRIRLAKNRNYWDRDAVAFRTIDVLAIEHWGTALNMYLTGEVGWLDGTIPPPLIPKVEGREDFDSFDYLGTYFLRLNVTRPPLDEVLVRRALGGAIDRDAICAGIVRGAARPATSLVPGYGRLRSYNPPRVPVQKASRAQSLMAEAGYYGPNPKPFPPIELHYSSGELHRDIAEFVAAGWRATFGIQVRLAPQETKSYLDAQFNLDYDISRSSWIADYVDPASFLEIFVTGGENNRTGWSNQDFDRLIAQGVGEPRRARRFEAFREAEKILLDESPILPIFHYASKNLVNPRLGGFDRNVLNEHFPKLWYWKDDAELRASRNSLKAGTTRVEAPGPSRGLYSKVQAQERKAGRDPGVERGVERGVEKRAEEAERDDGTDAEAGDPPEAGNPE